MSKKETLKFIVQMIASIATAIVTALARPATHTAAGSILSPPGFQHEA